MGDTERLLCPGAPQGPVWYQKEWLLSVLAERNWEVSVQVTHDKSIPAFLSLQAFEFPPPQAREALAFYPH